MLFILIYQVLDPLPFLVKIITFFEEVGVERS